MGWDVINQDSCVGMEYEYDMLALEMPIKPIQISASQLAGGLSLSMVLSCEPFIYAAAAAAARSSICLASISGTPCIYFVGVYRWPVRAI